MSEKNNLVDFIKIGVRKSATPWLYSMLTSHPEIKGVRDGLRNKEVNFLIEVIKPMTTETRQKLNIIFRDDITAFEDMISRDLSKWKWSADIYQTSIITPH